MSGNAVVLLNKEEGRKLARDRCKKAGLSLAVLEELITEEVERRGMKRKASLWVEFDRIFDSMLEPEDAD